MPKQTFFNLSDKKRRNIIQAAFEEFAENAYEDASIRKISEKADISIGSFYQYFESKAELYLYIIDFKFLETLQDSSAFKDNKEREEYIQNIISSRLWKNFQASSDEIRKAYYFRIKDNMIFDLQLKKLKKSIFFNKAEADNIVVPTAFVLSVMPFIMQELALLSENTSDISRDVMNEILFLGFEAYIKKQDL